MKYILLFLLMVTASYGATSERMISTLGPMNSLTVNAAITDAGTDPVTFGFDGGEWDMYLGSTFPSNISIKVYPGTTFDVGLLGLLRFKTNSFEAPPGVQIFSGAGRATGAVHTIYRWPEWGDTSMFNIGDGAYTLAAAGGVVTADSVVTTNLSLGGQVATNLDEIVTNHVTTNSRFSGYPKLTLNTGWITIDHSTAGSSLACTAVSFAQAFDGNTNTFTSVGVIDNDKSTGTYTIDLQNYYIGFVEVGMSADNATGWSFNYDVNAALDVSAYSGNYPSSGGMAMDVPALRIIGQNSGYDAGSVYQRSRIFKPFYGRYINITVQSHSANPNSYKISEVNVYGVEK